MNLGNMKLLVEVQKDGKKVGDYSFESFPVIFGRSSDCHLSLKGFNFISRNHGSITVNDNKILVTDLNSSNGIHYGNVKMPKFSLDREGHFRVEELTFKLKLIGDSRAEQVPDLRKVKAESKAVDRNILQPIDVEAKKVGVTPPATKAPGLQKSPTPAKPAATGKATPPNIPKASPEVLDVVVQARGGGAINKNAPIAKAPVEKGPAPKEHSDFEWKRIEFSLEPDPETRKLQLRDICLQGALIWQDEIYDVRNFALSDRIRLGPNQEEPLYVPIMNGEVDFGFFGGQGAQLVIPKNYGWSLYREGKEIPFQHLLQSQHIQDLGSKFKLILALNEVFSVDIGSNMKFRLRYVPIPRPLISKTWIENRDEFKRAITTSLAVHLALSIIALVSAPKPQAPKVKNVPERFAKLIVEPPPTPFAPPEPPPPPPPPEEPPPPPPPEEPPPVVEKPKPKPKPEKKIVKKVEKPKPVVTAMQKLPPRPPQPAQPAQPVAAPRPAAPPPPSAEQVAAQEMANLFNSMPGPAGGSPGGAVANAPINIQKGTGVPAKSGVRVSGIAAAASASSGAGTGTGMGAGLGLGAQAGQTGYAAAKGSQAGKRGVSGAVMGTPSFAGVPASQGITNDEVMKVVNKHLQEVHRCYERALFNDSNIVGRVEYEWEINPNGNVDSVSVKRSEVSNGDFLNSCVMGVFKKMKFPAAKNGQSTTANIGFPFGKN